MATRPLVLTLPVELVDALDEVACRYATTIGALAEQALVQLLLQQRQRLDSTGRSLRLQLEST